MVIDEIDIKIIEILQGNSRMKNTEIAGRLDISEASVRSRIGNLLERNVIRKFTIEIAPEKIGYNSVALVGLDVTPEEYLNAANKLSKFGEIKEVYLTTGDHMIMTQIWAKDGEELTEILEDKIKKIKGIERICPAIMLEKIKDNFKK